MSQKTAKAGEPIDLSSKLTDSDPGTPTNPIFLGAMAWSESTSTDEVSYLARHLEEEGWVRAVNIPWISGQPLPTGEYVVREVQNSFRGQNRRVID